MNITEDMILEYIYHISKKNISKIYLTISAERIKETILEKYDPEDNIVKKCIQLLDAEKKDFEANLSPKINQKNAKQIAFYFNFVLSQEKHELKQYIKSGIEQYFEPILGKRGNEIFDEDYDAEIFISKMVETFITFFHILKLQKNDEQQYLKTNRDKTKILNAITLLEAYANDNHQKEILKSLKYPNIVISKTQILSSAFYAITKCIHRLSQFSDLKIAELAKEAMFKVLSSRSKKDEIQERDYRIYENVEKLTYKNFTLKKYTSPKK